MKSVIACLALLSAATLTAQVSESIDVRIINVDVTVTSKGAPARGLTRDDFEIFEDGRRQMITNFYASDETRTTSAAVRSTAAPAAAPPVVEQQDPRFRRKVLVLVDNHHTTRHSRDKALRELEAMITDRFHSDYEWSIGVIGRGITLVLPLTSNKNAIHEALEIIRKIGTRSEGASSFAATTERQGTFAGAADRQASTLSPNEIKPTGWTAFDGDYARRLADSEAADAAEQVIAAKFTAPAYVDAVRGFASTSGRKVVLLLTGDPGFNDLEVVPHKVGNGSLVANGFGPGADKFWTNQRSIEDLRRSIIQEANASAVSFYIWNVEGLMPMGEIGVTSRPITNTSAVFWIAKETGGRLVTGNDAASAVREFDTASSTFYSLGYAPQHPDDGKYHSISVRLKRKGDYALEYRSGYSSSSTATQLERAMKSPTAAAMQANSLPVTLALGAPQTVNAEVTVPIEVKVPFRELQFLPGKNGVNANLVLYVSVFNDIGKNLVANSIPLTPGFKSGSPDLNGMLVYRNAIKLRKGERHRIVVALRDTVTDSVGMATEVVKF
jgi:VWFA-related protein